MKTWIGHGLSLIVGGFFVWTGLAKLADLPAFFQSILHYQLVGENLAWPLALYLPWLEVVAGLALLKPAFRLAAGAWIASMLAVFIGALASAAARGLDIDCGCVGAGGSSVAFALGRNGLLLAALAGVLLISRETRKAA